MIRDKCNYLFELNAFKNYCTDSRNGFNIQYI